jgi:hypothetical protein
MLNNFHDVVCNFLNWKHKEDTKMNLRFSAYVMEFIRSSVSCSLIEKYVSRTDNIILILI